MADSLDGAGLAEFGESLSGELLAPGDPGYDTAREVHNGLIDKRPALIARCANAADVADSVRFARSNSMEISVRGGGHNVAGNAVSEGGMMIDLAPMRGIYVDPAQRRVRAQGGVTWSEFNRATHQHGLATTGGVVSTTGIAGLTLGGGLGWLMGVHGMAVDNLVGVELVTADGEVIQASEENESELFWGLRGGGGNFGVAASLEYEVHPLDMVYGGLVAYPYTEAMNLFPAYVDLTAGAPDELTAFMALTHAPDGSGAKLAAAALCFTGAPEDGEKLLGPVRNVTTPALDVIGPMPYPAVNSMLDAGFPRGARNYWKSAFFKELSEDVIGVMEAALAAAPSIMCGMVIEHFHGEVTRIDPTATAYPHREPGYNLAIIGQWEDPSQDEAMVAWTRGLFEDLSPYMADAVYVNYMAADEPAERLQATYGPNWERLVRLKGEWDPDNVFHLNQNIDPAG